MSKSEVTYTTKANFQHNKTFVCYGEVMVHFRAVAIIFTRRGIPFSSTPVASPLASLPALSYLSPDFPHDPARRSGGALKAPLVVPARARLTNDF